MYRAQLRVARGLLRSIAPVLSLALAACGSDDELPRLATPSYASVDEVLADLDGATLDEFFERSFRALLARSPETLTDLGLAASFGQRNNFLDDVSAAFLDETYDLEEALLGRLQTYDRAALTAAEQVSFDVYAWYLADAAAERPFRDHAYSVSPMLTSEHQKLLGLFTQVHPLATRADAEDYVERLWRVRDRLAQVVDGVRRRADSGLLPPRTVLQPALGDLRRLADAAPTALPFYGSFSERLDGVPGLAAGDRSSLLAEAERAVRLSVKPGLGALADTVAAVLSSARADDGAWALPDGDAYYAYALGHHTTSDATAADVRAYGLAEVERLDGEIRRRFTALGYPAGESMTRLFARVVIDGGRVPAADCLSTYTSLIREAEQRMAAAIDVSPRSTVDVRGDPYGGYYVPASPDGARPGAFYAYVPDGGLPRYGMPTLAYHEAVPGHHVQLGIARELTGLPAFRGIVQLTAETEGWALYAERLASELGWYDDDPYGDLGRLQYELLRAVRLVVDTGVHSEHWSYADAVDYMQRTLGFPDETLSVGNEAMRYVSWPGQATAYSIGMRAILAARDRAKAAAGASFDLRAFHRAVLGAGIVPLPVLPAVTGSGA